MLKPLRVFQIFLVFIILACQSGIKPEEVRYNFEQKGKASYYANSLAGRPTASGETYHPDSLTAAHRHLPFGTEILVINPKNQRQLRLRVNDRGPFHKKRILDISRRAADSLGIVQHGVGEVIIKTSLNPQLADSLQQLLTITH